GVHGRERSVAESLAVNVAHDTNDLAVRLIVAAPPPEADELADRVLVREEALYERLIDEIHRRCTGRVAVLDGAAVQDRHAHRGEKRRRDLANFGVRLVAGPRVRPPAYVEREAVSSTVERDEVRHRHGPDARHRCRALDELSHEDAIAGRV